MLWFMVVLTRNGREVVESLPHVPFPSGATCHKEGCDSKSPCDWFCKQQITPDGLLLFCFSISLFHQPYVL